MKNVQWLTGLSLVALLLGSCTSQNNSSTAPIQKPATKPVTTATQPTVPAPNPLATTVPPGLILSKNPTTIPIPKGRIDPFTSVAVVPVQQVPSQKTKLTQTKQQELKPQSNKQQPNKPQTIKINSPSSSTQKSLTPIKPVSSGTSVTVQPITPERSDSSKTTLQTPPAVPAPSTELASAVQITGVMQVGGKVSAIVKAPDDQTSRYVSTGEYLSKGQVLVKRIELSAKKEPVVILEQNGVEVIKPVSNPMSPVASIQ